MQDHESEYREGKMKIKVKLDPGAFAPTKAHKEDAGIDLRTMHSFTINPGEVVCVDTGIHMLIPEGYAGLIKSKSGLTVKHGIVSDAGVIDAGYTGSIVVRLKGEGIAPHVFNLGDKIAQLVLVPIPDIEFDEVEDLEDTARGSNGFGSSGR